MATILGKIFNKGDKTDTVKGKRLTSRIINRYNYQLTSDIQKYKSALNLAMNGNRIQLTRMYQDALRDNHLAGIVDLRKERVLGTEFKLYTSTGDVYDKEQFNSKWFYDYIKMSLNEIYYGFSLIQIDGILNDNVSSVTQIPFEHVHIETGELIPDTMMYNDRLSYMIPLYQKWLVELVNDRKDLGMLADVIPLTIWKRSTMSAWAEYSEIFGMPIRIGKTSSSIETDRQRLAEFLKGLAKSAWAVLDEQETIEFVEQNNTDAYNIYDKFIDRINGEISKRVIGATMITDDGASYSQSNVHDTQFGLKIKSDKRNLEFSVNDVLIPKLVNLNVLPKGITFKFDEFENLSLKDQILIDKELNNIKPLDTDYLTNKYRVKFIKINK